MNIANTSQELETLSKRVAGARARRQEAFDGREIDETTKTELACIYHAAGVRAWNRCGVVIDYQDLFKRAKKDSSNPYSFQVRLAWMRELRKAGSAAVAECYRTHKLHDEMQGEEMITKFYSDEILPDTVDHGIKRVSRKEVRHAKECLVTFWSLSESRKWKGALRDDCRLLAQCVRVARGEGSAIWTEHATTFDRSALQQAIHRLRKRMGAGDVLMTDNPERSELALAAYKARD